MAMDTHLTDKLIQEYKTVVTVDLTDFNQSKRYFGSLRTK